MAYRRWIDRLVLVSMFAIAYAAVIVALRSRSPYIFLGVLGAAVAAVVALRRGGWFDHLRAVLERHRRLTRRLLWAAAVLYPILLSIPGLGDEYVLHIGVVTGIYVALAVCLNITVGYVGLLDLGIIAFYGIGAYITAILATRFATHWYVVWLVAPAAVVGTGLIAALVGIPTLRLRGDYQRGRR